LPDESFNTFYIATLASRDCILSRISTTRREVDALEKMMDFLLEISKHDKDQLGPGILQGRYASPLQ
jgi:hypothetical protein